MHTVLTILIEVYAMYKYKVFKLRGLLTEQPRTAKQAYEAIIKIDSVFSLPVLVADYEDMETAKKSIIGSGFIIRKSPQSKYYDTTIRYIQYDNTLFFVPIDAEYIEF